MKLIISEKKRVISKPVTNVPSSNQLLSIIMKTKSSEELWFSVIKILKNY